jgi:hypothetical protein
MRFERQFADDCGGQKAEESGPARTRSAAAGPELLKGSCADEELFAFVRVAVSELSGSR